MVGDSGLSTIVQKGIKMRMKTIISLYDKGNEIVSWCMLHMIVFSPKQQLLLHAIPYLGELNQL